MSHTETDMVARAYALLDEGGVPAVREVPILGRSADLACVRKGKLWTFEFKLRDWRRALRQARDHALAADYACVCMPRRKVTEEMAAEFRAEGIGLAFPTEDVRWPFEFVVRPKHSSVMWSTAHKWLWKYLRASSEADARGGPA